jgi:copper chaperone CopZ
LYATIPRTTIGGKYVVLKEFVVSEVSCGHCVTAITKEVSGAINEAGYDEVTVLN